MEGEFLNIQYRQNEGEPGTFFFIPGNPGPELMPSGSPAASMIFGDSAAILQLGVHWDVTPDQIKALQEHLRNQFPQLDSTPQLKREALTVQAVRLVLTMPDGSTSVLATTSSSGYPPFTALFNLTLDRARYGQARLALTGQQKVMKVSYEVSGQAHLVCTATVTGDVRHDLEQLDSGADSDALRAQIESALSGGRIQLTLSGDDDVSEDLRTRTTNVAKDNAANVLQRMLAGTDATIDAAHLYAAATLSEERPVKLVREADVGGWFTGSNSASFLVSPAAIAAPSSSVSRTFRLGFDAKDFPIAFIQVSCAGSQAVLQGPLFSPVKLTVETGKPVKVKTNYTDGGPAYETQLEAGDDVVGLMPQHLGFCLVTFDGTARRRAGAQRLQIEAKYRPEGNGSEEERTISWGYGDWSETWYVVSRDPGLAGVVEYTWQETARDGTKVDHPLVKTSETEVKL